MINFILNFDFTQLLRHSITFFITDALSCSLSVIEKRLMFHAGVLSQSTCDVCPGVPAVVSALAWAVVGVRGAARGGQVVEYFLHLYQGMQT